MEPHAVDSRLHVALDRGKPRRPLSESRRDGRQGRARGRACLLLWRLDGGFPALLVRRDQAAAPEGPGRVNGRVSRFCLPAAAMALLTAVSVKAQDGPGGITSVSVPAEGKQVYEQ